jgi:phytoene dehydrogenase-like protein
MRGFQELAAYFVRWKEIFDRYADDPNPPGLNQLIESIEDREDREKIHSLCYDSAVEVLRKFFPEEGEHGTIVGSLCASAVDGTHMGPYTKGSALSLSYHYCAGDNYDFKIPKGGIGSLSYGLERVFDRYAGPLGGEIKYKTPIENFIIEEGSDGQSVVGVRMKDGVEYRADKVISTLDAYSTYIRLMDSSKLPGDFVRAVEDIEYTNGYIQVHLCMKDLPTFTKQLEFLNGTTQSWLVVRPSHLKVFIPVHYLHIIFLWSCQKGKRKT